MAKFEMDTEFIRKLAKLLEETQLGEIELANGEQRIRIARPTVTYTSAPMAAPAPATSSPAATPAAASAGVHTKHPGAAKSPMLGTAYLSPEPGKPVFVSIGDELF